MNRTIIRRDFLKLSALTLGGLAFRDRLPPEDRIPAGFPHDHFVGAAGGRRSARRARFCRTRFCRTGLQRNFIRDAYREIHRGP